MPPLPTPPFRADQVGSLLRPPELAAARAKAKAAKLSAPELKAVEDRCIREAVAKQEAIGLQGITDGEFRRATWHLDFASQMEGVALRPVSGMTFQAEDVPPMAAVVGKVRCTKPIMTDHFAFLKAPGSPRATTRTA